MLQFLILLALLSSSQEPSQRPADAPKPERAAAGERKGPPAAKTEAEEVRYGLRVREPDAFEGYTLLSPLNSRYVYLIDMAGEVVHRWETTTAPGASFYLLEDGTLLRCGRKDENPRFQGGAIGGLIQRFDRDGRVLWQYELANERRTQHHDIEPMPNGNVLAIVWEYVSAEEALAAGRQPSAVGEHGLWPISIVEIRPLPPDGGEVVWEWRSWDHLVQDRDRSLASFGSPAERPGRIDVNADHREQPPETEAQRREREALERDMRATGYVGGEDEEPVHAPEESWKHPDWMHSNAVSYQPGHELIALSTRNFSEVWVIDHSTTTAEARGSTGGRWGHGGDLLYRWGNPRIYGVGTDADRELYHQHDAKWLPGSRPDELRMLLFNNGLDRPGDVKFSEVLELRLPFDAKQGFTREPGKPFGPAAPAWRYADPGVFYSAYISGAQRLPNGDTLICQGREGRIFEVTTEGRIVWEWWNSFGGDMAFSKVSGHFQPHALFRATRLAPDDPGVRVVLGEKD